MVILKFYRFSADHRLGLKLIKEGKIQKMMSKSSASDDKDTKKIKERRRKKRKSWWREGESKARLALRWKKRIKERKGYDQKETEKILRKTK